MRTEELIEYLKKYENRLIVLELQGIINTMIKIDNVEIKIDNGYLNILNGKDETKKIILNLHQLIKSKIIEKDNILLEFDQLQNVIVKIV